MLFKTLTLAGHTRSFVVSPSIPTGWEVRVEHDSEVVRQSRYTDWHRVERAVSAIEREVRRLQSRGWLPSGESAQAGVQSTNL
jgi:hypothetical protein